jgi:hypothetical protein
MQLRGGGIGFYYKNDGKHTNILCVKMKRLLMLDLMIRTNTGEP